MAIEVGHVALDRVCDAGFVSRESVALIIYWHSQFDFETKNEELARLSDGTAGSWRGMKEYTIIHQAA